VRERGSSPIELAAGVLLILVPVALLTLSFGPWLGRRSFVRSAAAEAARYLVISDGAEGAVLERVATMASNNGYTTAELRIGFCGGPIHGLDQERLSTCAGSLDRDATVSVRVEMDVPGVMTLFGTVGDLVTAYEHYEIVEPYRSMP